MGSKRILLVLRHGEMFVRVVDEYTNYRSFEVGCCS